MIWLRSGYGLYRRQLTSREDNVPCVLWHRTAEAVGRLRFVVQTKYNRPVTVDIQEFEMKVQGFFF